MEKTRGGRSLAIWIIAGILLATGSVALADQVSSKDYVAMVNGSAITQTDFEWEMHRAKQVYGRGRTINDTQLVEIQKRALENLIERELLYQESMKKGIKVDDGAVEMQLSAMKKRFPSEEVFKKEIGKINLTEKALREQVERAIATQQFVDKDIAEGITVSEKEILAYYDKNKTQMKRPAQVRASHILIKAGPGSSPDEKKAARKTMEEIEAKIKKGEDFSTLAKEYSQCPSAARGGDLNFFGRGQMVKPFEEAAFSLKPGEVSGIVETTFGYHVIKLMDKRPESIVSLEDVRQQLERHLKQGKVNEAIGKRLDILKKQAKIERNLPTASKSTP